MQGCLRKGQSERCRRRGTLLLQVSGRAWEATLVAVKGAVAFATMSNGAGSAGGPPLNAQEKLREPAAAQKVSQKYSTAMSGVPGATPTSGSTAFSQCPWIEVWYSG